MALIKAPSKYCWDFGTDISKGVHISEIRPHIIQQSPRECDLWYLLQFACHEYDWMHKSMNLTAPLPCWRTLKPGPEKIAPAGLQTPSSGSHIELWGQNLSWRSACLCRPSQTSPASVHNTEDIAYGSCHLSNTCLVPFISKYSDN